MEKEQDYRQHSYDEERTKVKWLTNYKDGGRCLYDVSITKINDQRFMISWNNGEQYPKYSNDGRIYGAWSKAKK